MTIIDQEPDFWYFPNGMPFKVPHDGILHAAVFISHKCPDVFEWEGKNSIEPDWFQDWARRKFLYIKSVAVKNGHLPTSIWWWKLEKIKDRFPLEPEEIVEK